MTDKEIEKALQDMLFTANWGSVEQVDTIPKNIATIKAALDYINRLKDNKINKLLLDVLEEKTE